MDTITSFFEKFFTDLSSQESLYFLMFLLGAFLLGLLFSFIYSARARRYRRELETLRQEQTNLRAEMTALREQYELKDADLRKAELEANELRDRAERFEAERTQWQTDIYEANQEIERLNATDRQSKETIEALNDQIIGLRARMQSGEMGEGVAISPAIEGEYQHRDILYRLEQMESRMENVASENQLLRTEIDRMKAIELNNTATIINESENEAIELEALTTPHQTHQKLDAKSLFAPEIVAEDAPVAPIVNTTVVGTAEARANLQDLMGVNVSIATEADRDDLTAIAGIGPFIEAKLNDLGIYTYEQIASFDHETIPVLTAAISFFPGRIERDNWVGQAQKLIGMDVPINIQKMQINSDDEVQTTDSSTVNDLIGDLIEDANATDESPDVSDMTRKDELRKIEGIGPKIQELLYNAGIFTFEQLAATEVAQIKQILEAAGTRFSIHNPTTWPKQAQLADDGNWDELKVYQDYLNGGKEPK